MKVVRPGIAFWKNDHPWIVLTDPLPLSGVVLCVNLTTLDAECIDRECVLTTADYAWIRHDTAVAFSYARLFDVEKIDEALTKGILKLANPPDVPHQTLEKMRATARVARQLSRDLSRIVCLFALFLAGCSLADSEPPIIVRIDGEKTTFNFTNTSDKPIHGIALDNRKGSSVIVIDTIEPHKTASLDTMRVYQIAGADLADMTVTCVDHKKGIKLFPD